MSPLPKLSIIIVSWNVRVLLRKCLQSITKYGHDVNPEIIVVDNNSRDGTQKMLAKLDLQNLNSIFLPENLGFARANNIGITEATGEYILLLNPDAELTNNSLEVMLRFMEQHGQCGILGPRLFNSDRSQQLSVRKFPTLPSQILILTKIHNFLPRLKTLRHYYQLKFDYSKAQAVDQIMGAALMTRKKIIDQLGLFDEQYNRIFEEVDFCYRVKRAGWKVYYIPTAKIIHYRAASFTREKIMRKQLDFNQGLVRFFRKNMPYWQYLVLSGWQPVSWLVSLLQAVLAKLHDPLRRRYKKKEL